MNFGGHSRRIPTAGPRFATTAILLAAAAALDGQTAPDPSDILNRARFQIVAAMHRLPKYTCVQTIDRSYFTRPTPIACHQTGAEQKSGRTSTTLRVTDRVRVDVSQGEGQEVHSWPGATHFETGDVDELIERGPASTGGFGGYLIDIFDNGGAQFSFVGAKTESGIRVFTYGYRVDEELSHYKVRTDNGWVISGYDGTFDIDLASLELLRITVNTLALPRTTGLCEAQSSLEYARVPIGDGDFLLPRESKLHLVHLGTLETNSAAVFTNCRESPAETALPVTMKTPPKESKLTLPAGTKTQAAAQCGHRFRYRGCRRRGDGNGYCPGAGPEDAPDAASGGRSRAGTHQPHGALADSQAAVRYRNPLGFHSEWRRFGAA